MSGIGLAHLSMNRRARPSGPWAAAQADHPPVAAGETASRAEQAPPEGATVPPPRWQRRFVTAVAVLLALTGGGNWLRTLTIIFLGALLSVTPASVAAATTATGTVLVVEGLYRWDEPLSPRGPSLETSGEGVFRVALQNGAWVIRHQSLTAATNAAVRTAQLVASGDGENVFVVHHLNRLRLSTGIVTTEAGIYPGKVPPPFERDAYNLWLAFVSPRVLTNASGVTRPPNAPDLSIFYHADSQCRYSWLTNGTPAPWLALTLRSVPRPLVRDFRQRGRLRYLDLPYAYPDGYPLVEGRWSEVMATPVGPWLSRCEFAFFSVNELDRNDAHLYRRLVFSCHVTNVYTGTAEPIPAGFDGRTFMLVTDHRFAPQGVASITYGLSNAWSAKIDAEVRLQAASRPRRSLEQAALEDWGFQAPVGQKAVLRWATRGLVAALIMIPLLWALTRRLRASMRKETNLQLMT